jgi:predicted transcriptional regulator
MSIPSSTFYTISLNTDGKGVGLFFGPLESEILEYLWSVYPRAVVSVSIQKHLRGIGRSISINTVNSTLIKLRGKDMVELEGDVVRGPGGNLHKASCSKVEFISHALSEIHTVIGLEFPHEWLVTIGGEL